MTGDRPSSPSQWAPARSDLPSLSKSPAAMFERPRRRCSYESKFRPWPIANHGPNPPVPFPGWMRIPPWTGSATSGLASPVRSAITKPLARGLPFGQVFFRPEPAVPLSEVGPAPVVGAADDVQLLILVEVRLADFPAPVVVPENGARRDAPAPFPQNSKTAPFWLYKVGPPVRGEVAGCEAGERHVIDDSGLAELPAAQVHENYIGAPRGITGIINGIEQAQDVRPPVVIEVHDGGLDEIPFLGQGRVDHLRSLAGSPSRRPGRRRNTSCPGRRPRPRRVSCRP